MMNNTKAQTLANLRTVVDQFTVPYLHFFTVEDWRESQEVVIESIESLFYELDRNSEIHLAVRSSAIDEDGKHDAKAGKYDSVLNVPLNDPGSLVSAIDEVIASYSRKREVYLGDEVIVQEMIENPIMSGVVFTHDLNTGAPYYVINYDDITGKTDTVTSGGSEYSNRTLYVVRSSIDNVRSPRFKVLLSAIEELEGLLNNDCLDIEFAMSLDLKPYLLQVRPITTKSNWDSDISNKIENSLYDINSFVAKRLKRMDNVFGETTVFGQMPDWNPVEMIGRSPRQLSYSLYETFITKDAWRIAREQMGYLVPEGRSLMVSLGGQPYIDTRLSFHSYLPEKLPKEISEKLVIKWVSVLSKNPELHDKIEFDVAITTYSFDIDEKIVLLIDDALTKKEKNIYKECVKKHAIKLIQGENEGSIEKALKKIDDLSHKQTNYQELIDSGSLDGLFHVIDDCLNYGTIPFSVLARHGFIAKTLLLSLVNKNILSIQQMNDLENSIETLAGRLVKDLDKCASSKISKNDFMKKYGHLRPGTYDILSSRYDQMVGFFDSLEQPEAIDDKSKKFNFNDKQKIEIDKLLNSIGLDFNSKLFYDYLKKAITGREYGKFVFTKSVSVTLEIISKFGELNGLTREDLSYIDIKNLLDVCNASMSKDLITSLKNIAVVNKQKNILGSSIRLPQIIFDTAGVFVVPFQVSQPNFITLKSITQDCILLNARDYKVDLNNKIVLIESADPGFDWIFGQKIDGLVTKFGGANSHMAIRCAEFGIPAAIGCGEQRFQILSKGKKIVLDCSSALLKKYE